MIDAQAFLDGVRGLLGGGNAPAPAAAAPETPPAPAAAPDKPQEAAQPPVAAQPAVDPPAPPESPATPPVAPVTAQPAPPPHTPTPPMATPPGDSTRPPGEGQAGAPPAAPVYDPATKQFLPGVSVADKAAYMEANPAQFGGFSLVWDKTPHFPPATKSEER